MYFMPHCDIIYINLVMFIHNTEVGRPGAFNTTRYNKLEFFKVFNFDTFA
jgi:hypothetical protein